MSSVFVLDNYDSFTFNLVQYLGELGADVEVARNDVVTVDEVAARRPDAVVISPGPGRPAEAGISVPLVRWCHRERVPLLGVCLGHQAVAEAFGGRIVPAPRVMHGKTSWVHHEDRGLFRGLPDPVEVGRYHSLVVDPGSLSRELTVTATADDGTIMGLEHRRRPLYGVQFHPESILTGVGMRVLASFLDAVGAATTEAAAG